METIKVLMGDGGAGLAATVLDRINNHESGHEGFADGGLSIEFVTNQIPHVIIMDIEIPELNGLATLRMIKEKHPEIEIIILAGRLSGADKMGAYFYGAGAILTKPVAADSLVKAIVSAYHKGMKASSRHPPPPPLRLSEKPAAPKSTPDPNTFFGSPEPF